MTALILFVWLMCFHSCYAWIKEKSNVFFAVLAVVVPAVLCLYGFVSLAVFLVIFALYTMIWGGAGWFIGQSIDDNRTQEIFNLIETTGGETLMARYISGDDLYESDNGTRYHLAKGERDKYEKVD